MGKRTRNLEYYGYIDQNEYMGYPNVDLSDIREVNKEQDKDIDAISGATAEKADKATVAVISGQLDTFIDTQGEINKRLVQQIRINRTRIEALEERGSGTTEEIEEIVDEKLEGVKADVDALKGDVEKINEAVTDNANAINGVSAATDEKISQVEASVSSKLGKQEAEDTYAKKVDTYTKSEVNALIGEGQEGVATKKWVEDNYLSQTDAKLKYATSDDVKNVDNRITLVSDEMYDKYYELNGSFTAYSAITDARLATLTQNVDTVSAKVDREVVNLQAKDAELQGKIINVESEIKNIKEISLPSKADKIELDSLKSEVANMSSEVSNKVDNTVYENDKLILGNKLDAIENNKADKTALEDVNTKIVDLSSKLDGEKTERALADSALGSRIDETNTRIGNVEDKDIEQDNKIKSLKNYLVKEIEDRKAADIALVGTSEDVSEDDTIWGAKKYADVAKSNAISSSNIYTDTKYSSLKDYVDRKDEDIKLAVTAKADKKYVDDAINGYDADIDGKIAVETNRAESAESALRESIDTLRANTNNGLETLTSGLAHTDGIVRSLTDWDGMPPYQGGGNGLVDVMHSELDTLKAQVDLLTSGSTIGEGLDIQNPNDEEFAIGRYNYSTKDDGSGNGTVFSIGVGSLGQRRNAFEVRKNGDIYMWIEGGYVKINDLLSMLTNETY